MIRSMTGFGQAERTAGGYTVRAEIRTVNHRYSEISLRLPRELSYLEESLKQEIKRHVKRGRTDASVFLEREERISSEVELNWPAIDRYLAAANELSRRYGLAADLTVRELLELPDLWQRSESDEASSEGLEQLVQEAFTEAAQRLIAMREAEGSNLLADLVERLGTLRGHHGELVQRAPDVVNGYRDRLMQRLRELKEAIALDEQRMATEAAIFAERCNVDEELTRLASHFSQFAELLTSEEPSGRRLDFLIQEMNREVNTIGSKASDAAMSAIVVEMKAELEKIREQVQNIE